MSKLPTKPEAGNTPPSLQDGIARLRMATGRPETRTLGMVCAVHLKGYDLIFERTDPRQKFKFSELRKHEEKKLSLKDALSFGPSKKQEAFNVAEFDQSVNIPCPYCNDADGGVICENCSTIWCGVSRSVTSTGQEIFSCPSCKKSGSIGQAEEVSGSSGTGGQNKLSNNSAAQLEHAKRTMLPKWRK